MTRRDRRQSSKETAVLHWKIKVAPALVLAVAAVLASVGGWAEGLCGIYW